MNNTKLIEQLRRGQTYDEDMTHIMDEAADALEAAQVEIDHWKTARASAMFAGEQMKAILDAQTASEPAAWQFKDNENGNWCNFMNEEHRQNTIEDGRLEIRALYDHTAPQVPLTEDEFVNCLVKSGCVDNVCMTYPSGQSDITRSSSHADRLLRAIEAHHKIGIKS